MAFAQILKDSAANWTFLNPTLEADQIGVESDVRNGVETDTGKAKMGDGVTPWNDLNYFAPDGVSGVKRYKALLTQTGTDAPVATVLENTLGETLTWTYDTVGAYSTVLTASGTLVPDVGTLNSDGVIPDDAYLSASAYVTGGAVTINVVRLDLASAQVTLTNGWQNLKVEIEVYP